jgi:hypothetical protein
MLAPIALFVYNRPWHTRQTVEALQKNGFASESDLFIFSDAARKSDAVGAVREVRAYIRTITGFRSVDIVERERNWGLANSIIDGVTTVVNQYGRIIVLEDDLVVSPNFLDYMNAGLNQYENEDRVMQISGYMFPLASDLKEDAIFLPFTTSWGWATWDRAWKCFDPTCGVWPDIVADDAKVRAFDLGGMYPYSSMVEAQFRGEIDSWAIRWYMSVFAHNGLVLFPRRTLVYNSGLEGSGTHGEGPTIWRTNRAFDDFTVRILPKKISSSDAFPLVATSIAQGQRSYFDRIRRLLYGIMART